MIFPAARPLEAACQELRALYVALNSPVVRQDGLPVGPASAAVALHVGVPGVSVAVRSVRTGQVAYFTTSLDAPPSAEMAVEAALSFGEALGFVFDADEVGPDAAGSRAAARLWCELIGDEYQERAPAAATDPVLGIPVGPFAEEPEVEPPGGPKGQDGSDAAQVREIVRAASPASDPGGLLSKFRWASAPDTDLPAAERKTA